MPRGSQPGQHRGGRQRGTPNKRSTELLHALEAHGCVMAEQIAGLFRDPAITGELKLDLLAKVLPYLYPQRKPIDPDGYLSAEQAAVMLGAQATKFRDALQRYISDAATVTLILDELHVGTAQGRRQSPATL